ncbi:MAG TPA: phenylalanine--tRNA ligase subunit beta [Candidatus Limnocylindria bacterium]|nr:phenylalanine--tRNA ligase subunit beta [Candidatus Limnocylindria bacterium]
MPSLKVPVSWLRDHVDVADVDEVAMRLHMSGTEVDRIERTGGSWEKVWVGRITALEKHPNADKLLLATVDYGGGRTKTVVTGATNLEVGHVVPYAETGATIVDGHTGQPSVLKPKPMRGILSEGMVLSAKELGLGDDHEGIHVLEPSLRVGDRLADAIGDAVIHFEIAPNRPDTLAVFGIAREVRALVGSTLREPAGDVLTWSLDPGLLTVAIEDPSGCRRFAAAYLEGVRIGPSPAWMQQRLAAAGMRPISNVVDITNYVMLELGQPLHAYDATRLRGRALVARRARHGEHLRTLDGVDRVLRPGDLVIADAERALGLAGIIGGEDSEIREGTTTVALEAASFEPLGIRRSSDRQGLQGSSGSAAARRFGLDLSTALPPLALARAVRLLREHAGARCAGAVDVHPAPRPQATVKLRFGDVERVVGMEVAPEEAVDILRRLSFATASSDDTLAVTPPDFRTDIGIAEDVVEEVARIAGYDRIPTRLPSGPLPVHERHPQEELRERARDVLVGIGLTETVSYAAIHPAWLTRLTPDGAPIAPEPLRIANPTTAAQSVMRPTLRASMLDTASRNLRHRAGVAIFEIAPVYLPRAGDLPVERWTIGILVSGQAEGAHWLEREREHDIHDIKALVTALFRGLRARPSVEGRDGAPGLHPGRSRRYEDGTSPVLVWGQLDPRVAGLWDLPAATFLAEIDLAHLLVNQVRTGAVAPSRFPAALRDIAVVVDEGRRYAEVEEAVRAAAKGLVESVSLVDLYRGPQAGEGKKSFALRLVLRSPERTLAEADVETAMRRIEGRLTHALGATIR